MVDLPGQDQGVCHQSYLRDMNDSKMQIIGFRNINHICNPLHTAAKNKNEYDFSYLVTGITANMYIDIDVCDRAGGKITLRFLIKK
jgi:hypothetical protein